GRKTQDRARRAVNCVRRGGIRGAQIDQIGRVENRAATSAARVRILKLVVSPYARQRCCPRRRRGRGRRSRRCRRTSPVGQTLQSGDFARRKHAIVESQARDRPVYVFTTETINIILEEAQPVIITS